MKLASRAFLMSTTSLKFVKKISFVPPKESLPSFQSKAINLSNTFANLPRRKTTLTTKLIKRPMNLMRDLNSWMKKNKVKKNKKLKRLITLISKKW